jgi:Big-like domain-containing protein/VCBS repeat protein
MHLVSCRFAAVLPILTFSVLAFAQGTTPSQTYLAPATGSAGQIGLAVNVRPGAGVQPPFTTPAGTVTLYNGTTAVGSPATLTADSGITSATFAETFGTPDASVAKAASGAVWGDFNEDGLPDLLVYGNAPGPVGQALVVQDFLCSATSLQNGTTPPFTVLAMQQLALPLQTQYGQTLAVLDVDGDGHLDLLAGNTVAYGKGDGTFGTVAVLPALATGYNQTYGVDIDGDGKLDIVAVDTPPAAPLSPGSTVQYAFTVFHNNGGSFTAMGPYPLAPSFIGGTGPNDFCNIFGLSFADVNGDDRIDVLSQSNTLPAGNDAEPARLNVMLNLGTGFGAPKAIDTSTLLALNMVSPAFADLNGDGKQDLIFSYQANTMNNGVATLLGNGDGTFAAPVDFTIGNTLSVGSALLPLVTEDFNADGKVDVALGSGVLLLGNGDGTLTAGTPLFTSGVTFPNPPPAYAVLTEPPTGTLPGGGTAPLSVLFFINLQAGANAVFVPNLGSSATATAMLAPGMYSLTAHYSGDATYAASVSNTIDVTIAPAAPKVSVTSSANPSYTGEKVTITATIANSFGSPAGSVIFSDGATALGTVPVSNGAASYTASFSSAGSHTITAAYGGDANNAAASGSVTQTVDAPIALAIDGSTSLTVASGQSVTTKVSVTGAAGFGGTVNFSCTGLPMYATCSFAPASVTVSGTAAAATTLTVSTAATTMAAVREGESSRALTVLACGLPMLGLLTLLPVARGRRLLLCLGFALLVSMTSLTGCGGNSSGETKTAAGTYAFNVVASSGSATSTASYKLTVQ